MRWIRGSLALLALALAFAAGRYLPRGEDGEQARADDKKEVRADTKGWQKGKGWGWVWGKDDEVGALNAMTPGTVRSALSLVKQGKVYDLGVNYDRESYKWPGHSPGEILTFRAPEGIKRQGDFKMAADKEMNPRKMAWHSSALFVNDNVATQIDGLAHITEGDDNHWYNGFKEADWGGNWGVRKCDATTIPPIIARGVLIDVAGSRKMDALPANFKITADHLQAALEAQKTQLRLGDSVFIRTGALRYWGVNGADHKKVGEHDSAGIDLAAARWLVEDQGAILIGADTSGLEHGPEKPGPGDFIPVHRYLLVEQGVHIGEFHYLEELAKDKAYEFCYVCMTNRIRGTVAGFALRPIAIR